MLLGLAMVGLGAAPAAAAGCWGAACAGHDPVLYGCSVSSTTTQTGSISGVQVVTVWNRYAANCNANWARAQLTTAAINAGYTMKVFADTTVAPLQSMCFPGPSNTGQSTEACTGSYGGGSIVYTDMVDGTHWVIASASIFSATGVPLLQVLAGQ